MVTLSSLSKQDIAKALAGPGLGLRTGPFRFKLRSCAAEITDGLARLYDHMPLEDDGGFFDYEVCIRSGAGLRRWLRPQSCFEFDGQRVFEPLPRAHAYALLEWAMNWCISAHAHQYLIIHAAVLERHGLALLMPAPPGSGKSTLCAALSLSGWRLLSDELALYRLSDGQFWPLCRPVSLKNQSIDVIRALAPHAVIGPVADGTAKGSVAHLRAADAHVARMDEAALPGWVVFPRYVPGAETCLSPRSRAGTVIELARNAFNVGVLAERGFHALADMVETSRCFDFAYSNLPSALACFDALAQESDLPAAGAHGVTDLSPPADAAGRAGGTRHALS